MTTIHLRVARVLLVCLLLASFLLPAAAAPLSGTKSVGPTGNYASITAAIADVQAGGNGLGGALVLELQSTYVSSVETFPLTIPALSGASAVNTLTIRPATGATARSISSADTTAATVDLQGAQFVTFDGRPGGLGTVSQLTIANTSTSGVALRFINEAGGNTVKYAAIRGVNTSTTSGTVVFSTTTGANGNDSNTIDRCDIRDGATTPTNGIYSLGTTSTTAQNNSGNTVSNCNVFNFYAAAAVDSAGVRLDGGNTDWTITGNSFYQTVARAGQGSNLQAIHVNNVSGNSFTVTGNFIGGTAPNAGGAAWPVNTSISFYQFQAIRLNVGTVVSSSVQGNTVSNMVWKSTSFVSTLPGQWTGIYVVAGSVNIGTVTGNTIGSGTGTASISLPTSATGAFAFGIGSSSSGTVAIANNVVGSMTMNPSGTNSSPTLIGIQVTSGTNTISGNTVGSTTTANSLNVPSASTNATFVEQVTGILSTSAGSAVITNNIVANLNSTYAGTVAGSQVRGIATTAGVNTITGNTVRNLSTTSPVTGTAASSSVLGIAQSSTAAGQTVSQNVVHSLSSTAASAAVTVTGIFATAAATGTNVLARNLVHSLAVASTSASSVLEGVRCDAGTFTVGNNMVRIGIQSDGGTTAGASIVRGIYDNGTSTGRNFYHNSVYVGGVQTSGASNTFAFAGTGAVNTRDYRNNIFANARGNSGGTGKHYAVNYGGTTVNPTGLTAGGNIFLASGAGSVLGIYNSADRTTLVAWQAATGQDATSAVADPLFVNATGTAALADLHLQPSNPAEGHGVGIAAVTDDFDGQTRSTLTPVDIGADAGGFTLSSDVFAPVISYPLLTSGSTASRVLTGWATITDAVGVASGASAPRFYFKKSTDADVFGVANNSTGNGWKYVTATGSSPFGFTIDYSLINGGSVTAGNTIQYFVVAQDAANNLGSSPVFATASANPPVQNVNGHGAVNSFNILAAISGTVTVGTGGTYPSLSGAGGLFAALNGAVLTGNVVVNITSDVTETGGVALNQWQEEDAGNYTLTIQPDSATMRTISGSVNAGLITLNGADRVTVDGRFGGSERYLTFRNTNPSGSASTIRFINDASGNTVRNCVVEGATSSALGVIGFGTGTATGNDNNLITGCQVRDLSTAAGVPHYLIASTGSSAAVANSGNTVSNNELFNFNQVGVFITLTGNDSWTLSGNNIYKVNATLSSSTGIFMQGGGTNIITGNSIHDLLTTATISTGISVSGTGTTTILRNRITAFNVNAATTDVFGIFAQGSNGSTVNVLNNQITLIPAASGSAALYGIHDAGATGGNVLNAFYNSVVIGGTESGTRSSWASLRLVASAHTSRDNIFLNLRTGGTGSHYAAGSHVAGGSYTVGNNVYAGTGATAANFMEFSTTSSAVPMNFATWQSATGATNSQAGIAGSGNFTAALFASAATGDLHLVPAGNPLVSNTGTPVAGVTTDYDGQTRSATTPDIGADEVITNANLSALTLSSGTLSPVFTSGTTSYTATVSNATTTLIVTPTRADPDASVTVNSASPATPVTLNVGVNAISIIVIAQDGTMMKTYTVSVTRLSVFQEWAIANGVSTDPTADGGANLQAFAFGMTPGVGGALVFNGTLTAGGTIGAYGLPITWLESIANGVDFRLLYVRRKDAASVGLTYSVEFAAVLGTWVTSAVTPAVLADDGTNQIVSVPYPAFVSGKKARFSRVRVTLAP